MSRKATPRGLAAVPPSGGAARGEGGRPSNERPSLKALSYIRRGSASGNPAENKRFGDSVAAKPVAAVDTAHNLASGPEVGNDVAASVKHLSVQVRRKPAVCVVGRGRKDANHVGAGDGVVKHGSAKIRVVQVRRHYVKPRHFIRKSGGGNANLGGKILQGVGGEHSAASIAGIAQLVVK